MHGFVDDVVLAEDEEIVQAIRLVHRHVGLVIEPAGVVVVAALLGPTAHLRGQRVATILCGSNVTEEQLRNWLG
jgi:threonine dehydratase